MMRSGFKNTNEWNQYIMIQKKWKYSTNNEIWKFINLGLRVQMNDTIKINENMVQIMRFKNLYVAAPI